ncbi:hypothetical protein KY345_04975 [Candidatus Woesearchaeota archaeon]|nr:hypothetical protein [Candidatus Woesearchaeota archaeon]
MKIVKSDWMDELEEENVYSEIAVEDMLDSDELSPAEAGFMHGYDEAG